MKLFDGMGRDVTGEYVHKDEKEALLAYIDCLKAENLKLKQVKSTPKVK